MEARDGSSKDYRLGKAAGFTAGVAAFATLAYFIGGKLLTFLKVVEFWQYISLVLAAYLAVAAIWNRWKHDERKVIF
ncbi:hypothetical protein J4475_04380 [Candidatus Woesearchaeota archaeon]|nr:hypothetical protein [Candidatus Woesearchaeota archaeon]